MCYGKREKKISINAELRIVAPMALSTPHAHTAGEIDGSRQSSVFSSVKHIRVMNINTKQLVADRERDMWVRCHVVKPKGRVFVYVCGESDWKGVYNQLAAINCPEPVDCRHS